MIEFMSIFENGVAVITGAAAGIGKALAIEAVQRGMKVALCDVDDEALQKTGRALREKGGEVWWARADVASERAVRSFARRIEGRWGPVSLLCNNAGVSIGGKAWETSLTEWQWVFGINLFGVVNGVRAFLPGMEKSHKSGMILNVASTAAFHSGPALAAYKASKAALVSFSETLREELVVRESLIAVSILCPGWVKTGILTSRKRPPSESRDRARSGPKEDTALADGIRKKLEAGLEPQEVARLAFDGMTRGDRFIFTDAQSLNLHGWRGNPPGPH